MGLIFDYCYKNLANLVIRSFFDQFSYILLKFISGHGRSELKFQFFGKLYSGQTFIGIFVLKILYT